MQLTECAGLVRVLAGLRDRGGAPGDQVEMGPARLFTDARTFRSRHAQLGLRVNERGREVGIRQLRNVSVCVDDRSGPDRQRDDDPVAGG